MENTGNNTTHSLLSASSAFRWSVCPASAVLQARLPAGAQSSFAAREGTGLHALLELALVNHKQATDFTTVPIENADGVVEDVPITEEQQAALQATIDYVSTIDGDVEAEQRVLYGDALGVSSDVAFGTCDVSVLQTDDFGAMTLHIIDAKFGRSPVQAVNNTQLALYAIGKLVETDLFWPIDQLVLHIIQPRVSSYGNKWEVSRAELEDFVAKLRKPARRIIQLYEQNELPERNDYTPSGEACFFCKIAGVCKAQEEIAVKAVEEDFAEMARNASTGHATPVQTLADVSENRLGQLLALAETLKPFTTAIQEESMRRLKGGQSVTGYKLVVARQGNKKWKDPSEAVFLLEQAGFDQTEALKPPEPITPSEALKHFKPKKKDSPEEAETKETLRHILESGIVQAQPALSLVSDTDPRDRYTNAADEDDFPCYD